MAAAVYVPPASPANSTQPLASVVSPEVEVGPPVSVTAAPLIAFPLELTTLTINAPPSAGVTRPWITTGPPPAASAGQVTVEVVCTSSAVLMPLVVQDGAPLPDTNRVDEVTV